MPSNYTGIPGVVDLTVALPIDSDSPSAQLFRTPYETLLDNDAELNSLISGGAGIAITTAGGTRTLTAHLTIGASAFEWRFANDLTLESGGNFFVRSGGQVRIQAGADIGVSGVGSELFIGTDGALNFRIDSNTHLESGAHFTVDAGADFDFAVGSTTELDGDLTVNNGGNINIGTGADIVVSSGGTATFGTGSFLTLTGGAQQTIDSGSDIAIANEAQNFRLCMTPTWIEQVAGVNGWDMIGGAGTWVQTDVAAQRNLLLPITLPPGDVLVSVSVQANGASAGGPGHAVIPLAADRLTVHLIRVATDGTATTLASMPDDSANAAAYDISHIFTMVSGAVGVTGTMPQTLSASFAYYLLIEGETGANAVANTLGVTAVFGACTARSFRGSGTSMIYV